MGYLGKADELLRWSSELRGLQLPQLPASLMHPWHPADKGAQPSKPGSAEPEHSQGEIQPTRGGECSTGLSTPQECMQEKSGSSSGADDSIASADQAQNQDSHSAPQQQREAPSSESSDTPSKPPPGSKQQDANNSEHRPADNHAHLIWSSWLQWQNR